MLDRGEVKALEPRVSACAGLWSPETGIVDVHELMDSYRAEASANQAEFCFVTEVTGLERTSGGWRISTLDRGGEEFVIEAATVVNSAGLSADHVATLASLDVDGLGYRQHYCKGDYFSLASSLRGIANHLIYPVPARAGLGIHITLDLGGKVMAGPDTEYVDDVRYDVDPAKAPAFGAALRRYLPEVRDEDLSPDYAGIRPKLQGPTDGFRDYLIEEASAHGAPGLVNLLGIESPGLTASEAIARKVAGLL